MKSKKPRKQHAKLHNMPKHTARKSMKAILSKELRKKYAKRSMPVRKDDKVKVMRGKHKGKTGKIININIKKRTVGVEKIVIKKPDGTEKPIPINTSNVMIMDLVLTDKKREKILGRKKIKSVKEGGVN